MTRTPQYGTPNFRKLPCTFGAGEVQEADLQMDLKASVILCTFGVGQVQETDPLLP